MDVETPETEKLREGLNDLYRRRLNGDLPERTFLKELERQFLALLRATAAERLVNGEKVALEHHVSRTHTRLTRSIFHQTEQEAVSLYATDRRLLRQRLTLLPDRPLTREEIGRMTFDDAPYEKVRDLRVSRAIRPSEIAAGAVIAGVAWLFRETLLVTGSLLFLLGILGMLHGLVLPTRSIEVRTDDAGTSEPISVLSARRKSARVLLRYVRSRVGAAGGGSRTS
jgi:hypothetical protein